jgi:hypothetical protein
MNTDTPINFKDFRVVLPETHWCTRPCSSWKKRSITTVVTTLVNNNSRWNSTRPQFHFREHVPRIDVEIGRHHSRLLRQC